MTKAAENMKDKIYNTNFVRPKPDIISNVTAKEETDINLNIITGKEEASIIISTHIDRYLQTDQHCLYVDVGGGSTELTIIKNRKTLFSKEEWR
jgi:exopolyphosphatase/pppGpp-phosphohydrolase